MTSRDSRARGVKIRKVGSSTRWLHFTARTHAPSSEISDDLSLIPFQMSTPRRNTRSTVVPEPPLSQVAASDAPPCLHDDDGDAFEPERIVYANPRTPGRKTTVSVTKTVSLPDVAECAHAAEVAAPVKDDGPAEGGNAAACPQTPTDSPRRTLAERGPLPADALALLNGIDLKNSVQKDVEKPEAQKLLAVAQHIDALCGLFSDDSTMWPSNEHVAMVLFDFAEINPNNIQHHLVRDVTDAMREGCVEDLLSALKLLGVHVRATRAGLLSDSPRKRTNAKITERQINALRKWNYDARSDGFESIEAMTVAEAGVALDALIAQSQARKKARIAAEATVVTID